MKAFEYAAPTSVEDAVSLLRAPNAVALSGGTDLISRMKDYVTSPDRVVYLKDIKTLAGISGDAKAGGLTIGAGTSLSEIVAHAGIRDSYPALWQATPKSARPRSATWPRWAATCSSALVAGITARVTGSWP